MTLEARLRHLHTSGGLDLPLPGRGQTSVRHRRLADIGRENLALARLAEAHIDAVAILAEAGRTPEPDKLYGVWAAETPDRSLRLDRGQFGLAVTGSKMFCTGAGLVDRALITVCFPQHRLVDVNVLLHGNSVVFDGTAWITRAFNETQTATASFVNTPIAEEEVIEGPRWYLERPGFWHGACAPASCWAGGAIGLVDYALSQPRNDSHTMAHLGAMKAAAWAMLAYLDSAGREIDADPVNRDAARTRALALRHLVNQACSDVLRRFARAYGPRPLAFDAEASRRYQELDLYIRQCHAEHDLEELGRHVHERRYLRKPT